MIETLFAMFVHLCQGGAVLHVESILQLMTYNCMVLAIILYIFPAYLYSRFHTGIVHCPTVSNNYVISLVYWFLSTALLSSSTLFVRSILNESILYVFYIIIHLLHGYNFRYGYLHTKAFCIVDFMIVLLDRLIHCFYVFRSLMNYISK